MLIHMRTTIVIDNDVSLQIERIAESQNRTKKEVIGELLRKGLAAKPAPGKIKQFETKTVDLGKCRFPNMDNISEILAVAEGESSK